MSSLTLFPEALPLAECVVYSWLDSVPLARSRGSNGGGGEQGDEPRCADGAATVRAGGQGRTPQQSAYPGPLVLYDVLRLSMVSYCLHHIVSVVVGAFGGTVAIVAFDVVGVKD